MISCLSCKKIFKSGRRNYCFNCYEKLITSGVLQKIFSPTPTTLTEIQKNILIGSLLGDGSLELDIKNRSKNARLIIKRKLEDKDYLLWEYNLFKDFCSNKSLKEINPYDKRTNKYYPAIYFRTRTSSILTDYYFQWYNSKKNYSTQFRIKCNNFINLVFG